MYTEFALNAVPANDCLDESFPHDGMTRHLNELNSSPLANIINMAGNRAYIINGRPYADLLHFKNIHEHAHNFLIKKAASRQAAYANKIYIGVGGTINLSYIAATKPACAILCDINPLQKILWDQMIDLLENSPTPDMFLRGVKNLEPSVNKQIQKTHETINFSNRKSITYKFDDCASLNKDQDPPVFRVNAGIQEWLNDRIAADHYWLEEGYYHLHELARRGSLTAITLDILDQDSCIEFSNHLKLKLPDFEIGMFYISSIADFLAVNKEWTGRINSDFKTKILDNLDILNPKRQATIVDSSQMWLQEHRREISINNGFFPTI